MIERDAFATRGHPAAGGIARFIRLAALGLTVSFVSLGGASVTMRGLPAVGHGDTFDTEIGPLYELEFAPNPKTIYTQPIEAADLDAYRSWRGHIEVQADFGDCADGSTDCYHRSMTVEDWRPIDEKVLTWRQLNQN